MGATVASAGCSVAPYDDRAVPVPLTDLGDLSLWLSGPQSSGARPMPDGRQPEPGGWNRLVITVDALEPEVDRLRQAGLTFRSEIVTGPGGKQIVLDDSAGNPVELFEPA